ncbi:protein phosphatase 2C domain-containing protein [Tengunoibacter tsumagoiensis]|uniref:PPM-type phosphatase domain-containing protein n=1 Tax=Tengunoibacter tsumagoiensis TaxID=2014871 RepID=A0A401ZW73_9CHLR|nr:protein phosphatase 2C domain-containing protein [Tengunoibacter tsumagoiensis]GCE11020.1 hypothetical protein KTT_08790 [Tengunoibacter tsumagoiensis]
MLCPLCNTPNRDNAKFCKGCGRLLATEVVASDPAAETVAPEPTAPESTAASVQPVLASSGEAGVPSEPGHTVESTEPVEPVESATVSEEEDPRFAPTQILTPAQMHEFHVRKWQHEHEAEQKQELDIADMPTILVPPAENHEDASEVSAVPPVLESEEDESSTAPEPVEQVESTEQPESHPATTEEEVSVASDKESTPVEEQATDFPILTVGTIVGDRYSITQVLSDAPEEHLYEVTDRKGYLHCWNCGSEENAEGDEFCNDCGAELQNYSYIMHAYPPAGSQDEASVLHGGVIVNTLVDQGLTYVIEQPQEVQSSFPTGVRLLAACDSDAGDLRRSDPNEDSTLVLLSERVHESIATPAGIFLVADGMGGHDNGQGASRLTTAVIAERVVRELLLPPISAEKAGEESKKLDEEELLALVHGAVEDANAALCQLNQREKSDMGSTLTGFLLVGDHAYIFNVGDSRTYMLRDHKLYQLTNDHSLVGQLVAGGLITPDDVYTHPQRSQIYRSIGDKLNVQIDIFKQQVHPGDILLSCSDGLWEMVRDPQITEILNNAQDPQTASAQLIEAANTNGGEDNVSAVVVFVR